MHLGARSIHTGSGVAAAIGALVACDAAAPPPATTLQRTPSSVVVPPLPEPESQGARLVAEKCGACHIPPRPTAQLAAEWPLTVQRMQKHRVSFGKGALNENELAQIIAYLQRHARLPAP